MGWLRNDPTKHMVRYTSASGREYDLTLIRTIKLTDDDVPLTMVEHPDGTLSFGDGSFASIDECCREYGCVLTDFVSVEQVN